MQTPRLTIRSNRPRFERLRGFPSLPADLVKSSVLADDLSHSENCRENPVEGRELIVRRPQKSSLNQSPCVMMVLKHWGCSIFRRYVAVGLGTWLIRAHYALGDREGRKIG
jgi:hypothetical protein